MGVKQRNISLENYHHFQVHLDNTVVNDMTAVLDWIVQCFTSPPTQYMLYVRRFLQVKKPNQQYRSTEGKIKQRKQHKTDMHRQ